MDIFAFLLLVAVAVFWVAVLSTSIIWTFVEDDLRDAWDAVWAKPYSVLTIAIVVSVLAVI